MKLVKSKKDGLIRPVNDSDMPLFRHCSNDSIAVTEEFFELFVKKLLWLHDVVALSIENEQ